MDDFERKENQGSAGENVNEQWSEDTDTNQYVNWEGQERPKEPDNAQNEAPQQPPRKEYGTQYGYYGTPTGNQNYYSQNGGQWDFNRYESAPVKKSGGGFKVFIGVVAVVLGLCLIGFAAFGLLKMLGGKIMDAQDAIQSALEGDRDIPDTSSEDTSSIVLGETPELALEGKPEDDKTITTSGVLTAAEVYKKVIPSVVGVVQYQYSSSMEATGSGSGVIISSDGYIITNAHVVDKAEAVKVILNNQEEYEARIIGSDKQTDIAVLKIEASNLTAAELGDSNAAEVGEDVYALGNPGGLKLQSSITEGIISGLNRSVVLSETGYTMTLIQTSAAINPGNSGGALANEYGQVIGITNSKLVSTSYEGVGFAIPSATAIDVAKQLMAQGYVSGRAILGITGRTIDSMTARYYSVPQGVMIATIDETGAFGGTEAQAGDIITSLGGETITSMEDVSAFLAKHSAGDQVEAKLYRFSTQRQNDAEITITITLAENKG